jgi:hypothetical protein
MVREREFRASVGVLQCGDLCGKPVVIGLIARSKSRGECWAQGDWRRETYWDPTFSTFALKFAVVRSWTRYGHDVTQMPKVGQGLPEQSQR